MNQVTVTVLGKAAVPGLVKTRLTPLLSASQAAEVYLAMLKDVVKTVKETDANQCLYWRGAVPSNPLDIRYLEQRGVGLAESIANAFDDSRRWFGYLPTMMMTSDIPEVTVRDIETILGPLRSGADVVLAPSPDGGFWGLGLAPTVSAEAIRTVPMSRVDTGAALVSALEQQGHSADYGSLVADVDTPADLVRSRRNCRRGSSFAAVVDSMSSLGGSEP